MIGSLFYFTASRPNISYSVRVCARYQANSKESHMIALSKKQNSISLSTAEVEYNTAGSCCILLLWMQKLLHDYGICQEHLLIYCDNTSAINISKNPVQHSRTKHIEIRHHFIRELVEDGTFTLEFIHIDDQKADLFTKPLDSKRFEFLRQNINVISMD